MRTPLEIRLYQRDWKRQRRTEIRRIVGAAKNRPCMDCRKKYPPYVMDFDHRPDEVKCFNIGGEAVASVSPARLLAEILKCDVVCSNCHRERTHKRRTCFVS